MEDLPLQTGWDQSEVSEVSKSQNVIPLFQLGRVIRIRRKFSMIGKTYRIMG